MRFLNSSQAFSQVCRSFEYISHLASIWAWHFYAKRQGFTVCAMVQLTSQLAAEEWASMALIRARSASGTSLADTALLGCSKAGSQCSSVLSFAVPQSCRLLCPALPLGFGSPALRSRASERPMCPAPPSSFLHVAHAMSSAPELSHTACCAADMGQYRSSSRLGTD